MSASVLRALLDEPSPKRPTRPPLGDRVLVACLLPEWALRVHGRVVVRVGEPDA